MTLEQIIKSSLDDWTEHVPVPPGLSSSALRLARRQRSARRATAVSAAVLAAAVAVTVPTQLTDDHARSTQVAKPSRTATDGQPPTVQTLPPSAPWTALPLTHAHSGNTTVSAHVDESPPVHLIAARDLAVSAYNFESTLGKHATLTWYMYNSTSGTYQHTTWSWVDVEPGLGLAAVLAGGAPQKRIGIVDMATGGVIRWVATTQPVGIVRFSPDGTKLLATTYIGAPGDILNAVVTGFILVDLRTGYQTVVSRDVGTQRSFPAGAYWTYNGAYIYIMNFAENASAWFFTPDGHATGTPANGQALTFAGGYGANVSPNGLLANTYSVVGNGKTPLTGVKNLATGEIVGTQPVEDLQGWANNDELIAWGCGPGCPNENHQRLVLVSVDGKHITPLSGFVHGKTDVSPGQWRILLTRR